MRDNYAIACNIIKSYTGSSDEPLQPVTLTTKELKGLTTQLKYKGDQFRNSIKGKVIQTERVDKFDSKLYSVVLRTPRYRDLLFMYDSRSSLFTIMSVTTG